VAPQIEVEDRRQLRRRRRRDQLSAGLESTVLNELVQRLGCKVRHHARELWRIEQAREQRIGRARLSTRGVRRLATTIRAFRHERAMISISRFNKQS
jgi:hypothetical protein